MFCFISLTFFFSGCTAGILCQSNSDPMFSINIYNNHHQSISGAAAAQLTKPSSNEEGDDGDDGDALVAALPSRLLPIDMSLRWCDKHVMHMRRDAQVRSPRCKLRRLYFSHSHFCCPCCLFLLPMIHYLQHQPGAHSFGANGRLVAPKGPLFSGIQAEEEHRPPRGGHQPARAAVQGWL